MVIFFNLFVLEGYILKLFLAKFVITMKTQHQVVLSLGSNQGNRLENIQNCIHKLHQEVGTIVRVSRLYESEAWGFESEAFYNCALVMHTSKDAEEVLSQVLSIENQLGRIRQENQGYQSRIIDIDLISFDNCIVDVEDLKIPHPLMQDRKFVLLPIQDLHTDWRHPILNKSITELIEISSDKSNCQVICDLTSPLVEIPLHKLKYITIEGNIGVGKTTLTTKIAQDYNAKIITERFAENPFLAQFYEDQKRFAFPLEVSFLEDREKQLKIDLENIEVSNQLIVADYAIYKSLIFAEITLEEQDFYKYKILFDSVSKSIVESDLLVYLYQTPERLLANIKKRNRGFEENISVDYLEKINTSYIEFIQSQSELNSVIIDVTNLDFVNNQADYIFVLDEIEKVIRATKGI
jgi:deoxyguanosine kinase